MRICDFKRAINQDGNLRMMAKSDKLLYVLRQINYGRCDGKLSYEQAERLEHWAYDKYGN